MKNERPPEPQPDRIQMPEHYPMSDDNPLINATDEEIAAFIRERRKIFDEKYAGMTTQQISERQRNEREAQSEAWRKERNQVK